MQTKILLKGMMRNPILLQVNFSHNRIGDAGITELAQYLVSEVCFLVGVKLSNNYFSTQGQFYNMLFSGKIVTIKRYLLCKYT